MAMLEQYLDSAWYQEVEQAKEFVTLMDADNCLLYVNHNQNLDDLVGRSVFDFVDPIYHDLLRRCVQLARETGVPQHFDSEAQGPEGKSLYSNWVFRLPADDQVVVFVATDVTHQDRVEAALELSETTLRSLLDASPDTILVVDRERKVLFYNRDDLGFGSERILGSLAESFVTKADKPKVIESIQLVLESGIPTQYDTVVEGPGDKATRFTTRVAPITSDGKIDRVMLVATDVTDQYEAERDRERLTAQLQQAQKMEALGHLTGGVAHDFNNLLTAISNNCELAKMNGGNTQKSRHFIDQAIESVRRAATLTQRLLAFSRKQQLCPVNTDANSLLKGMLELLRRTLSESISVRTSTPDDLWSCRVDPAQLESAILNLAVNARDAMPRGGKLEISNSNVVLTSELDAHIPAGEYVRIAVSDDGSGMPSDVVKRAFDPFFTTKEVGQGSGLGLSMVYGFVRQSDGHVRIMSALDQGTTVEIYLPRSREDAEADSVDDRLIDFPQGHGELILLVEDDAAVRSSVDAILKSLGYLTETVADGHSALSRLRQDDEVSLVLSDIGLPGGMNGFELAEKARARKPGLPILLVSGYSDLLSRNLGSQNVRVLAKPHSPLQLARALRDSLAKD